MIKVLKKSIVVLATVSLLVATSGISFAATNQKVVNETSQKVVNKTSEDKAVQEKLDKMEAEIGAVENTEQGKISDQLKKAKTYDEREKIKATAQAEINKKSKKILSKYGFKPVNSKDDVSVGAQSTSSNITLTDEAIYYDSTSKLYRFSANWNFTDGTWDSDPDIEDIAAIRMNNSSGYSIYSSYATVFSDGGYQTGYDNNGIDDGGLVNKRFEDSAGVVWNAIDTYTYNTDYGAGSNSDHGRNTMYFKKTTGGTNKVFLDYHHNFNTSIFSGSASISGITLSGISLTVNYSNVNQTWQRTSTGRSCS